MHIYVDGVLEGTAAKTGLVVTNDLHVTIGAVFNHETSSVARSWNGLLDDVWVYSYGISEAQVQDLAAMGALVPRVDAGGNQTISIQDSFVQLDATVTDDGKPEAATLTWTQVSCSDPCGVATFDPCNIEDPCVTFSEAGIYVLRLTADDTLKVVSDEVTITVENPTCQDVINDGLLITGDISGPEGAPDCHIDLYDFAAMAGNWLRCNDPREPECEFPY